MRFYKTESEFMKSKKRKHMYQAVMDNLLATRRRKKAWLRKQNQK